MHPIIFELGPITIASYGLMLATAILFGIYLARRQGEKEGIPGKDVESMAFWVTIAGIVGARFLYTFVENTSYYLRHPIEFFYLKSGGMSFLGALFFSIAGGILYCYRKKISFLKMADIMAPPLCLGIGIAKIGCFLAGCCYGHQCDLPWGVTFTDAKSLAHPKGVELHPVQLYETFSWGLLYLGLVWARKYRKYYGDILFLFVILFSILRPLLETFRGEPRMFETISIHQVLSIAAGALALVGWTFVRKMGWTQPVD